MPTIKFTNDEQIDSLICDLEGRIQNLIDDGIEDSPDEQDMESAVSALNDLPRAPGTYGIEISGAAFVQLRETIENTLDMETPNMEGIELYSPLRENIGADWLPYLHAAILELPFDSTCGEDCLRVITAAAHFLKQLSNVTNAERNAIRAAAVHECEVYYFG